jgi:AcrR family transcriptional regulator
MTTIEENLDPRVRRTRGWIREALIDLVQEKPFSDISVADIARQADIARVTFYQHFAGKEELLLSMLSDFFSGIYQSIDPTALATFLETGEREGLENSLVIPLLEPAQAKLILVGMEQIGSRVRWLAVNSFQQALSQSGIELTSVQAQIVGIYHVGGILALLEQQLMGAELLSARAFQQTTLDLLRSTLAAVGADAITTHAKGEAHDNG